MPKSMVLGNGKALICLDKKAQVRDFYYHYVGLENHIGGVRKHRVGAMVDDDFFWFDDDSWEFSIDYIKGSLVSNIKAVNKKLSIEVTFNDTVYNEKDIFLRRVIVKNNASWKRKIKIYFHQEFRIYDTERGDTAYYDPDSNAIIHYEGRRVFLVNAQRNGNPVDDFSIGNYGIEGKEGTWKDAEDGKLEKNAVEYAFVDSVIGFYMDIEAHQRERIEYWIAVAKDIEAVKDLNDYVLRKTPEHLVNSTKNYWKAWSKKTDLEFRDLDHPTIDLFKKSLLIMRTHTGNNGEIIASGDSDMLQYGKGTYAYVWPRDASFIALAFDRLSYDEVTRKFFIFCNDTISREGYFFHKYLSDKSVGSSWHPWIEDGKKHLAIQEEETALVIYSLWKHYKAGGDVEFIESVYNTLVKKAAEFMCSYRDLKTGLPLGSYDIWEQDYGTSTFASSAVFAGLESAAKFARLLGKKDDEDHFSGIAEEVRSGILRYLYNEKEEYFYKLVKIKQGKSWEYNETIDMSSFFGVFKFGVLDAKDPLLRRAYKVLKGRLLNTNRTGGVIRYEGDMYHQKQKGLSNSWFITTLWLAQYEIATAKNAASLKECKKYFDWVLKYSEDSGMMAEQLRADNEKPISASPLIWSHAEFVTTVADYLEKFEDVEEAIDFSC